jgi:hypothetical protein
MRTSPAVCVTPPTMPSADFSHGVRVDYSALSHLGWPMEDLPGSDTELSARRRWMYTARPNREWRASWSRAHSPRAYHTSSPVPVRRPARVDGASFRPRLAATPWPCSSPSAPRTPGTRTFTALVLCHARHTRGAEPRALARRLQPLVGLLAAGERNTRVRVLPPLYFG